MLASIVYIACTLEDHSPGPTEGTPLHAKEGARFSSKTDVPWNSQSVTMKTKTSMAEVEPQHWLAVAEAGEGVASFAREAADGLRRASAGKSVGGVTDGQREGAEAHEQGGVWAAGEGRSSAVHTEHV